MEDKLYTSWEVVQSAIDIHYRYEDFEHGDIMERIHDNTHYTLKEIPLYKIEEVSYYVDEDMVEEYEEMDLTAMPPVILGKPYGREKFYPIIDGGHRITVKRKLNQGSIMAYVPKIA